MTQYSVKFTLSSYLCIINTTHTYTFLIQIFNNNNSFFMKKVLLFALVAASTAATAQNTVSFQCGVIAADGITSVDVTGNWVAAAGLGADWDGALTLTDANSDGIWEGSASLPDGTYECKFRGYTAAGGPNWENVPAACATNGNRALVVAGSAVTVGPYCLGTCDASCPVVTYHDVIVNMNVNMTGVNRTIPVGALHNGAQIMDMINVTGNLGTDAGFTDWSPGTIAMTDANSDNIYSVSLTLKNKVYAYKFLRADWWNTPNPDDPTTDIQFSEQQPNFDTTLCLAADGNRALDLTAVAVGGIVNVDYVWERCDNVLGTSNNALAVRYYYAQPNPFTGETVIRFSNDSNETFGLTLTNAMGQVVRSINNITTDNVTIDGNGLAAGMYFATLRNQAGQTLALKVIAQ